jgi:hypothetical protein
MEQLSAQVISAIGRGFEDHSRQTSAPSANLVFELSAQADSWKRRMVFHATVWVRLIVTKTSMTSRFSKSSFERQFNPCKQADRATHVFALQTLLHTSQHPTVDSWHIC